jgi:hypothetical protein
MESKPQQTGTGFLIRQGEGATTSGSTSFRSLRRDGRKLPRRSTECAGGLSHWGQASARRTTSLRDGVTSNSALFESAVAGANLAPAANLNLRSGFIIEELQRIGVTLVIRHS